MAEHFTVTYDGPALAEHRMPVTELAPALLALSDMFQAAHRVVSDGSTPPPGLDVVASRDGSFAVEMILEGPALVDLFSSREAVAGASGVALLTPVVGALRWVQRRRRSGRETSVTTVEPGQIRVSWPDGTVVDCPAESGALIESMDFRRNAKGALNPLSENAGIETVEIRPEDAGGGDPVVMYRDDARELDRLPDQESLVISDTTREVGLNPLKPSFETGYKWWVSDGQSRFWVDMHDLRFLQEVESSRESFSAGDILRCRLRDRQLQDPDGSLHMEHVVLEVIQHLQRPPPDPLPWEE